MPNHNQPDEGHHQPAAGDAAPAPFPLAEFAALWQSGGSPFDSFESYRTNFERLLASRHSIVEGLLASYSGKTLGKIADKLLAPAARHRPKRVNAEAIYLRVMWRFLPEDAGPPGCRDASLETVKARVRSVTRDEWQRLFPNCPALSEVHLPTPEDAGRGNAEEQ